MTDTFKVEFSGFTELIQKLNAIAVDINNETNVTAKTISFDAENKLKQELSYPGTGIAYMKTKDGKWHIASAPGQPPAPDTGNLRSSIRVDVTSNNNSLEIALKNIAPYAEGLETGTDNILPRPFFVPTINRNMGKWINMWKEAIEKTLKRAGKI